MTEPETLMELERFKVIVETYGSRESRWPTTERDAAKQLLSESTEARDWLNREMQLDNLLDTSAARLPDLDQLTARITSQAQTSWIEQLVNWLLPDLTHEPALLWRPATAAVLPLVLGITLGLQTVEESPDLSLAEETYIAAISGDTVTSVEWENLGYE